MTTINTITIRRAAPQDHRLVAALGRNTFLDSFGADNHPQDMADYLAQSFSPQIQADQLAQPGSLFLIAEAGTQPVGYARLVEAPSPACVVVSTPIQLERLYAARQWIGHGVGSALIDACIAEAKARDCDGIWLGVWEKNERAIRFYQRWGFDQIGTQPFTLGHDRQIDLVMWLSLNGDIENEPA
ncbi:MAG: GNAT family N-acetyltransferase [Desulfosarcina sp.]|jgi:GNAT superfamily N-acetyltransferase